MKESPLGKLLEPRDVSTKFHCHFCSTATVAWMKKDYVGAYCNSLCHNAVLQARDSPESNRTQAWIPIQKFISLLESYFLKF